MSESGYSSDECEFSENLFFKSELARFKEKYKVNFLMIKSANGTLYSALARGDGVNSPRKVVVKSISRKSTNLVWPGGKIEKDGLSRKIPREIKFHQMASNASQAAACLIEYFELANSFLLVIEQPSNSIDLLEFVNTYGAVELKTARQIIKKTAMACLNFHQNGVCHRDIKDENILFNPTSGNIKIIDFGCATSAKSSYTTPAGTAEYFPPEMRKSGRYDMDGLTVYSLGCLLYTLLTGKAVDENFDFFKNVKLNFLLTKAERQELAKFLDLVPSNRINLSYFCQNL